MATQAAKKAPEQPDDLAESIRKIARAADKLLASGLNQRAIIVLLASATGETQTRCRDILNGLAQLERQFTTR